MVFYTAIDIYSVCKNRIVLFYDAICTVSVCVCVCVCVCVGRGGGVVCVLFCFVLYWCVG